MPDPNMARVRKIDKRFAGLRERFPKKSPENLSVDVRLRTKAAKIAAVWPSSTWADRAAVVRPAAAGKVEALTGRLPSA